MCPGGGQVSCKVYVQNFDLAGFRGAACNFCEIVIRAHMSPPQDGEEPAFNERRL